MLSLGVAPTRLDCHPLKDLLSPSHVPRLILRFSLAISDKLIFLGIQGSLSSRLQRIADLIVIYKCRMLVCLCNVSSSRYTLSNPS